MRSLISKKAQLNISFAWLFALIVGATILFLAIYGVTKFISTEEQTIDVQTGKEIGILLNPLETGFETGKTSSMTLPVETRIYNKCNSQIGFGRQTIQLSQQSFGKWTETREEVGFTNKYIFSDNYSEGKLFYLFSKPFSFPFKVADLVYLTSSEDEYCFIDTPEEVLDELESLNQKNIFTENCSEIEGIKKVCFGFESDCYARVNYKGESVEKNGNKVYFEGDALMFAAIFSDASLYECQLQRLMERVHVLTKIYSDKAGFIERVGCDSNLNLVALGNNAKSLENSNQLISLKQIVEDIDTKNKLNSNCKLW